MSANRPTRGAALVRMRLTGLAFIVVIVLLIALTIAMYQKAFTDVVTVTLQADRAGNQLTAPADVKVNGVIVGEAREVRASADGADIELALEPDMAATIPTNVSARLLPKTLFGEKFVSLVLPDDPASQTLQEGDVIAQDRSETAREFSTALDNLLPLLQTLKPEQVSTTLNALSTTLRGRGERIGNNFVLAGDYFEQFNPELPTLAEDFRGIADFADNLDAAAPDFLAVLDNLSVVNRNLVDQEQQLETFLRSTSAVSGTFEGFLEENEDRFVTLARDGRLPLELFARYAPEFPCLAAGIAQSELFIGDVFGGLQPGLHITLEFTQDQGGYRPREDEPQYNDTRPPVCFGLERLPNGQPDVPAPDINYQDGYNDQNGPDDSQRAAEPEEEEQGPGPGGLPLPAAPVSFTNPDVQRSIINAAVAPVMGTSVDDVPDVAHLLFGPVARGTAVGLSSRSAS
ncbi:MAG: MCE family protein [Actinomycetota bacterium]|nr:MCE family protein [Actinomycetota bacterium]